MLQFHVAETLCTRCGQCVRDCPSQVIVQRDNEAPYIPADQEADCIRCQHCLAICPAAALSILGKRPSDSLPVEAAQMPHFEQMARLVRSRRSVRQYRNENVDPALLRQILATVANAPTGVNSRRLTFSVIDDAAVMERFRRRAFEALQAARAAGRIPERFAYLHEAIPAYFDRGVDILFRGAPHALIISAPPDSPCPNEDATLALAYFELLAYSAGLGTVWCGMMKMVLEVLPDLKAVMGVPKGYAYYPMLFGLPAVRYRRTVQRDDTARIHRVTM